MDVEDQPTVAISKAMWDGLVSQVKDISLVIHDLRNLVITSSGGVGSSVVVTRGDSISSVTTSGSSTGFSLLKNTPSSGVRSGPPSEAKIYMVKREMEYAAYRAKSTSHMDDLLDDPKVFDLILENKFPLWLKLRFLSSSSSMFNFIFVYFNYRESFCQQIAEPDAMLSISEFANLKAYEKALLNTKQNPLRDTIRLPWLDVLKLFSNNFFIEARPLESCGLLNQSIFYKITLTC